MLKRLLKFAPLLLLAIASGWFVYALNQDKPVKEKAEPLRTDMVYVTKGADGLFKLRATELDKIDKFLVTDGEIFSTRNVLYHYKGSKEVVLMNDVTYSAYSQYSEIVMSEYLKDNPDFDYSVVSSLSGVGKRFGMNEDPVGAIAKQGAKNVFNGFMKIASMVLFMVIILALMFRMQNGQLSNSVDMHKPDQIDDQLDDLVGMNDIKTELLQLEEMIHSRGLYEEYGVDKPFNVMMTGPAGTGKTKLARCLAKRLNVPLFYASAASLESGYVGGGPRTLKKLYAQALKQKRAIIFLDEAEGLLMTRARQTGSKYENDTTTTLLSLLDGVNTKKGVEIIWVVASNFDEHKMQMDEAMLRRFHLKINFRLPNLEERREILRRLIDRRVKDKVCDQIDLDHLASVTSNMSPALLEGMITRASLIAVQERKKIDQDVLLRAFERVAVGLTDRATTEKMDVKRRIIAVHEAGHFLLQMHHAMRKLKGDVTKLYDSLNVIKISTESVSKMGALGFVLSKSEDVPLQTRQDYEERVCELYGGMANEEIFYKEAGVTAGAHNDIEKVTDLLHVMFNEVGYYQSVKLNYGRLGKYGMETGKGRLEDMEAKASELYRETKMVLQDYTALTNVIVGLLMDHYVMTLDDVMPHIIAFFEKEEGMRQVYEQPVSKVA